METKNNQPTLASTLAIRTSRHTNQKLQKSLQVSRPKKNYFLKSPSLLKILKTQSHNPTTYNNST